MAMFSSFEWKLTDELCSGWGSDKLFFFTVDLRTVMLAKNLSGFTVFYHIQFDTDDTSDRAAYRDSRIRMTRNEHYAKFAIGRNIPGEAGNALDGSFCRTLMEEPAATLDRNKTT